MLNQLELNASLAQVVYVRFFSKETHLWKYVYAPIVAIVSNIMLLKEKITDNYLSESKFNCMSGYWYSSAL